MRFCLILSSVTFLFCAEQYLCGQQLNQKFIKDWLLDSDSTLAQYFDRALFIVEGVPFSLDELDAKIEKFDYLKDRISIDCLNPFDEKFESSFFHKRGILVIIYSNTHKQKRKIKKESIAKALALYENPTAKSAHGQLFEKYPVVVLNDEIIDVMTQARSALQILKIVDIENITVMEKGPQSRYGSAASQGLVKIWTK